MYCPNCGNQLNEGLKYCNSCGGRVGNKEDSESKSIAKTLALALGIIGSVGFGALLGLIAILLKSGTLDHAVIVLIVGLYLTSLSMICVTILRNITKLGSENVVNTDNQRVFDPPSQLRTTQTNQLEEPKQQPASVVENTTRTLDHVPIERK